MPKIILNGTTYAAGLDQKTFDKIGTDTLDTDAQDLSGAVNELNSSLNTKIAVEHIDLGTQTIGAGPRGVYTKSIAKSGYTAVGIVDVEMSNNYFYLGSYIARGNNAQVVVHSANNAQTSQQIWIDVLYIKN